MTKGKAASAAKRYWDPAMFWEGIRQLRVIGVLYIVLLEVASLLLCYDEARQLVITQRNDWVTAVPIVPTVQGSYYSFQILLPAAAIAAAFLMTIFLFRFQNHRESSDFYHSLPNTRTSLFTSFFSAVLAWVAAGVVLAAITSAVGLHAFSIPPTAVPFSFSKALSSLLFSLAAGLYTAAVTALAMAFTGTLLSNLLVTALLALAPRLLVTIYFEALESMLPILPPMDSNSVFDLHYNPLYFCFTSDWYSMTDSAVLTAAAYALVVGALYTVFAWLLFRRRRSETAGQSAPNRILQAVFRLTITMLICLAPCVSIANGYGFSFDCVVVYFLALAVYFLYELVTTRKVRNLWKAVPALGILAVMNVAFIGSFSAVKTAVLFQTPEAEEIESVTFRMGKYADNYLEARAGDVSLEDGTVRQLVADRLSYLAESLRDGDRDRFYAADTLTVEVDIHTATSSFTRRLTFTSEESRQIHRKIQETEQYRDAYMDLPPISQDFRFNVGGRTPAQNSALYDRLLEDVQAMGFDAWHELVNSSFGYSEKPLLEDSAGNLCLSTLMYMVGTLPGETGSYSVSLPLSTRFPRTLELYLQYVAEDAPDAGALRQAVRAAPAYGVRVSGLNLTDAQGNERYVNFSLSEFDSAQSIAALRFIDRLLEQYEAAGNKPADLTQPVYALEVQSDGGMYTLVYFNVEQGTLPDFSIWVDPKTEEGTTPTSQTEWGVTATETFGIV